MAHGISAGMLALRFWSAPKMCGKVVAKEVAAWMDAKWILPMLSL
jgi:hypothetical protein